MALLVPVATTTVDVGISSCGQPQHTKKTWVNVEHVMELDVWALLILVTKSVVHAMELDEHGVGEADVFAIIVEMYIYSLTIVNSYFKYRTP